MAIGVAYTGGATMVVPHGEPLWNQFRQRPQHPVLEAARAATASSIVNFLMIRFSGGGRTWAKRAVGRDVRPASGARRWGLATLPHAP